MNEPWLGLRLAQTIESTFGVRLSEETQKEINISSSRVERYLGEADGNDLCGAVLLDLATRKLLTQEEIVRTVWRQTKRLTREIERDRRKRPQPQAPHSNIASPGRTRDYTVQDIIEFAASIDPISVMIVEWLMEGLTYSQIAEKIGKSPSTISYHIARLRDHLSKTLLK